MAFGIDYGIFKDESGSFKSQKFPIPIQLSNLERDNFPYYSQSRKEGELLTPILMKYNPSIFLLIQTRDILVLFLRY